MNRGADHVVLDVDSLSAQIVCGSSQGGDAPDVKEPGLGSAEGLISVLPRSELAPRLGDAAALKLAQDACGASFSEPSEEVLSSVECRICREDDEVGNMESPCDCAGSLKFAHRKCIQRWCFEKGDTRCEICGQRYRGGYSPPPPPAAGALPPALLREDILLAQQGQHRIVFRDPRVLAAAAAAGSGDPRFLALSAAEHEEYAQSVDPPVASWCRTAALILLALLLLQHAFAMLADPQVDDPALVTLFMLRVVAFLLPCYIMARALSILQLRRRQQEAALSSAANITLWLQANRHLLSAGGGGRPGGAAGSDSEGDHSSSSGSSSSSSSESAPSTPRSAASDDGRRGGGGPGSLPHHHRAAEAE